jgi:hypothetical protein
MELEKLLEQVQALGAQHGATIYEILFRNAGVGVLWHESAREKDQADRTGRDGRVFCDPGDWRSGLVVYQYHKDLRTALEAELARLQALTTG